MRTRKATALVALALAFAISVAGCGKSSNESSAPVSLAASSVPTPNQKPFSFDCSDALSRTELDAVIPGLALLPPSGEYSAAPPPAEGPSTSQLVFDGYPLGPPSAASLIAAAGRGYFECSWGGTSGNLGLGVLPDGAQLFEKMVSSTASDQFTQVKAQRIAGDDAISVCAVGEGDAVPCVLDILDGTNWIELVLDGPLQSNDIVAWQTSLAAAAAPAIIAVRAAGNVPAPTAPPSRWAAQNCGTILSGILSLRPELRASDDGLPPTLDMTDNRNPLFGQAVKDSGGLMCFAQDPTPLPAGVYVGKSATVMVVPGVALWAWPAPYPSTVKATPVIVEGVTAARYLCATSQGNGCWIEGVIDDAVVTVAEDGDQAQDVAALAAVARSTA